MSFSGLDIQKQIELKKNEIENLQKIYNAAQEWTYKTNIGNQLNKLNAELNELVNKSQIPVIQPSTAVEGGSWFPFSTPSLPSLPFPKVFGKNKKEEELEQKRLEQEKIDREQAALRKQQFEAEQAELDALITKTTLVSKQRNLESMEKYERQKMDYFRDVRHKEEVRELRNEEEDRKLRMEARLEEQRLQEEREKTRKDQEIQNAKWMREIEMKNQEEVLRTSQLREKNKRILQAREETDRQKREQQKKEISELNEKVAREREEQLEELRRLDEEVKKSQEECKRKYEELERKSREQMEILLKLLERARWNRTIEANWDNRIRALKSTDRRIYRSMGQLRTQLVTAKIKEINPEIIRRQIDGLKTELTEVKRVMDREVENLENFYKMSGKQFILDIQKSLLAVSDVLFSFIDYLDSQYSQNFNRESVSVFYNRLEGFEMDVTKAYKEIPTMDRLKNKYRSSWDTSESSSSSSSHVQAITEDDHVIRIEEID